MVSGLFELEPWKLFTERNFSRFPRYARDQCLEAQMFFSAKEVDAGVLERALGYCLENDTLSFTNLRDTYAHFERESLRREPVPSVDGDGSCPHKPLAVSQRQLSEYEEAARERMAS